MVRTFSLSAPSMTSASAWCVNSLPICGWTWWRKKIDTFAPECVTKGVRACMGNWVDRLDSVRPIYLDIGKAYPNSVIQLFAPQLLCHVDASMASGNFQVLTPFGRRGGHLEAHVVAAVKLFFHATKSRRETEDYELWVAMSFPYLLVCLHIFCDFAIHLWDRCITKNLSLVICKVLKVLDRFTTATQQDDGERRMGLWPWWSPPLSHQSLQTGSRLVHQGHNCADGLSYIGSCLEPHQSEGGSSRRIGCSLQIWNTITLCLFDKMQIHCLIFGMARVRDGPIVCWLNVTWSSICFWKSRTHPRLGIFLLKKASRCAHFFSSPDVEGHVGDWEGRRRQGCEEWLDPSGSVSLDQKWCAISILELIW